MESQESRLEKDGNGTNLDDVTETNYVTWDPQDPTHPRNWPLWKKRSHILLVALITFLTPFASSMVAPAIPQLKTKFHFESGILGSFIVSIYLLGYVFGPLVVAPMSEMYGRLPVYHFCNVGFVVTSIACAVSTNVHMLIGFRFLAGTFGSSPIALGGGTISDMIVQEERGLALSVSAFGSLWGPVLGPVAGGFVTQSLGWRWVFWIITIASGTIALITAIIMRETYAPLLLERKASKLRKSTGNTSLKVEPASSTPISATELFWRTVTRPSKMILFSPIILSLGIYTGIVFAYLYLMLVTFIEVYEQKYGFGIGITGLTYLGLGVGCSIGMIGFGTASDRIMKRQTARGKPNIPENRLITMIPAVVMLPVGLFWYGWTAEKGVYWLVPIIGTAITGCGIIVIWISIQAYLVDAFTTYAVSAVAANTIIRSFFGAFLPLAGQPLYDALGLGWGNSLLAFIAVAMIPTPWVYLRYGVRMRERWALEL
ncbi:hypothetical protein HYFRA_00010304 [Hymenoscyphus fraxineus]|uniref:Major facilitator superfamily (MFS) profile domain-containing protein n=1 Tax=Hymenoscyphus fraxineus TaxID=746836 RepID=A0A9N9KZI7_9HELO|nr:hypothetical protein HYFRA_00010304 [Hymenoscyphus fraxineus]